MSRQVGSALGVAIFVAILGTPTRATVLSGFRNGWMFLIAMALTAAVFLAVGPVRLPDVRPVTDADLEAVAEPAVAPLAA